MIKGICKLCGEHKDLCNKSHILPKFCYKNLREENNFYNYFYYTAKKPFKNKFSVEYDGGILCLDCENKILGSLDDYGSKIINNDGFNEELSFNLQETDQNKFLVLSDSSYYDYKKFKLFLLSILWRAGISSRNAFAEVKLSHDVEMDLRNMILNNNPGKEYEYACGILLPPLETLFRRVKNFNPHIAGFVMSPVATQINNVPAYQFIIMGTQYILYINKEPRKDLFISTQHRKLFMLISEKEDHAHLIYHRLIKPLKRALSKK